MTENPLSTLLGIDIGRINTRASLFGVVEGKYRLLGCETAQSSLGPALHPGAGVGAAMAAVQRESEHIFLKAQGGLVMPATAVGLGVDHAAITTSAGPQIKTVLLGLSRDGSSAAGRALVNSMPLELLASYGLADLVDDSKIIESLLEWQPELIILVGGEDGGEEAFVKRWIEILRIICCLLPARVKPSVLFAGNGQLEDDIRRRLESLTSLHITANIQPVYGEWDLVPAQNFLEREMLRIWEKKVPGMKDLLDLTQSLRGTKSFSLNRCARFLGRTINARQSQSGNCGVLILDLGGGSVAVSASLDDRVGSVIEDARLDVSMGCDKDVLQEIHRWAAAPVTMQETAQYLATSALHPAAIPTTLRELALSQSLARYQLRKALKRLSKNYPWFDRSPRGLCMGGFEPVIASGAALTLAPTPGEAMLILLDALQPCGITTMVLDRYHLLPMLSVAGEAQPVLPVHVMNSNSFENLGTVIAPVSNASEGEKILSAQVNTDAGKSYAVDIEQGTLRRLLIPAGVSAVLEIEPGRSTDVGFGGAGVGGRLKITGGLLGVVIDARGRPLRLPDDDESRVEQLRRWLWILGG
jgi:hypothetical protein